MAAAYINLQNDVGSLMREIKDGNTLVRIVISDNVMLGSDRGYYTYCIVHLYVFDVSRY